MRFRLAAAVVPTLLCLLPPAEASAQYVFDGGSCRITVGGFPSSGVSTGSASYVGANGLVPGYGYPPYYSSNWPSLREALGSRAWLCKPPAPAVEGAIVAAPEQLPRPRAPENSPQAAQLSVRVPADAELLIAGEPTVQRGNQRSFVSPPLPPNQELVYELRARWQEHGRPVEVRRTVPVRAGASVEVDLTTTPRP